jgi:fluoroquinolone resistance protein
VKRREAEPIAAAGAARLTPIISSQGHYTEEVFKEIRLDRVELVSTGFHDCVFSRSSFVEAAFRSCQFVGCTFRDCDLSLAKVAGSRFASCRFEGCKAMGVNWSEADWPRSGLGNPIGFFDSAISHSTFIGLSVREINICDCLAVGVNFRGADLSRADFGGTDLAQSLFGHTDLSGADLSRARNYHIDPGQNTLTQARFSLPEALSLLHNMDIVLVEEG